ncbi:MAG TPA: TauD/TfdA family dioxygenase [Pyrinomonadaceae bacterium]|nr:TauD/TfdA family dioxygenase [Pyrinomonadaceae bacterium]
MSAGGDIKRFDWASLRERAEDVAAALIDAEGHGAVLITSNDGRGNLQEQRESIIDFLPVIGEPILVYKQQALWKHIGVSLEVAPDRVGGIGDIPLHVDLVNASHPPDFVVFLSEAEDLAGGGKSVVCPFRPALEALDDHSLRELSSVLLKGGRFYDLENVGVEINPFPVLEIREGCVEWVRFSAKSNKEIFSGSRAALEKFQKLMTAHEIEFELNHGEAMIINQRLAAHGRRRLGPEQGHIPAKERRSIYQLFVRAHAHALSRCFVYPA